MRLFRLPAVSFFLTWSAFAGVLDPQKQLEAQTFWDNRDFDWYRANIPLFECPDADITTTWYYRWELTTKHLTYGSPESGYSYTEFIDRPFWSGAYGAISCPAGHQLYEVRWLRDPTFARDFSRYWFRTTGAQPRNYSTWLADSVWAVHLVHPDDAFTKDLLPDLARNYAEWEKRLFVPGTGLFWQIGHDDGMEFNIASRQTRDIFRGAPSYRPSFNAYMWADAQAIAHIADLAGDRVQAAAFRAKADAIKARLQDWLWDPKRDFFLIRFKNDELNEKDFPGKPIKAGTLIYEDGPFAGSPEGRELIGYVPWQFNLPDPGYESAWKFLMSTNHFFAPFGPSFVGRNDPLFVLKKSCCWWSGQSWPYANTQTLKALANLLQNYRQEVITRADYLTLLQIFARTHRKDGKPYIAEAAHPFTGSWEGHDGYNHSEHYFHSGYCDLIVTGLAGLKPRNDDTLELDPLAPADWPWFALDNVPYRGRSISIVWDRDGSRYGLGAGLHVLADGREIASSKSLKKLTARLPAAKPAPTQPKVVNFLVSNDGDYYPQVTASHTAAKTSLSRLNDGNYWYTQHPPNRWTSEGSTNAGDWIEIDLGVARRIDTVKLYLLDDGEKVVAPASFRLEHWNGSAWAEIADQTRTPEQPAGHRANVVRFPALETRKLRVTFVHGANGRTGLTELEAWGPLQGVYEPAPPPAGNLALNQRGEGFPKCTASFHDVFGGVPRLANDGRVIYRPTPLNRWTSYGSTNAVDWLEVDFGEPKTFGRVELCVYDDRGGVQPPTAFAFETWDGQAWQPVADAALQPERPVGSAVNTATFAPREARMLRVLFTNRDKARSGVTEILVWKE